MAMVDGRNEVEEEGRREMRKQVRKSQLAVKKRLPWFFNLNFPRVGAHHLQKSSPALLSMGGLHGKDLRKLGREVQVVPAALLPLLSPWPS